MLTFRVAGTILLDFFIKFPLKNPVLVIGFKIQKKNMNFCPYEYLQEASHLFFWEYHRCYWEGLYGKIDFLRDLIQFLENIIFLLCFFCSFRFFRRIYPKNRCQSLEKSIWSEGHLMKKFQLFSRKILAACDKKLVENC